MDVFLKQTSDDFGPRIESYLKRHKLTVDDFALMSGVSPNVVGMLKTNTYPSRITERTRSKLRQALEGKPRKKKLLRVSKIGRLIASHCESKNISPQDFARQAGVNHDLVVSLIKGTHSGRFKKRDLEERIKAALNNAPLAQVATPAPALEVKPGFFQRLWAWMVSFLAT